MRSMTAFARREVQGPWGVLTLELRSVNHRYLEISPRLPEEVRGLDTDIRGRIGQALARGKVDCNVRYQAPEAAGADLEIDRELVTRIAHASREIDALVYNPSPVNSLELLKWPGVLKMPAPDPEQLHAALLDLLGTTLDELIETRAREGEKLKELILQRAEAIATIVDQVRGRLPTVLERQRERLAARLAEVKSELDPARLEQEMVLFAGRIDVDEELDRLAAHVTEIRRVVAQKQPVGRRLDFLMQECNREANTLGSKSADIETTRAAVDLKVLIEQMREQVQNIE